MAIYEYQCNKCGFIKEFIVKVIEHNSKKTYPCPKCDGALKKIMSASKFIERFKLRIK